MSIPGDAPDFPRSSPSALRRRVARQVRRASSSFYWAMRLSPKERRDAMFAIYAFCRHVDDVTDDGDMPMEKRRLELAAWRREIDRLYADRPERLITCALAPAVARFGLEKSDFHAVVDGMEMDLAEDGASIGPPRRRAFDLYCDRVACAVGRLCVRVFGEPGERGRVLADAQGRALQITNILRDVHEDAARGRLYLPLELLKDHGVPVGAPRDVVAHPAFVSAWRALADEAAQWYRKADLAMAACDRAAVKPIRVMLEIYRVDFRRMCALSDAEIVDPAVDGRSTGKVGKLLIALRHGF